ncbi:type II toxin-antitoxin system Phd/YefM family antitoxin [Schaalia sp. Marseille-Q2122]|uniref:type II toxin-antitoxin system Phd/YefM family antitoxin n=1 Tax=Schaalia sp. Marseille-Q2122 TaxID=2736604 RepID=UPI00158A8255|nr:type II toxin-antitoxin system Phd/YefM family antitoxin [Schaalia sp. Marseille-Q2122]
MATVTLSQFRQEQSTWLAHAQREPVTITSRGATARAVVVSPELFSRAMEALENQQDIKDAAAARMETGRISHADVTRELGF